MSVLVKVPHNKISVVHPDKTNVYIEQDLTVSVDFFEYTYDEDGYVLNCQVKPSVGNVFYQAKPEDIKFSNVWIANESIDLDDFELIAENEIREESEKYYISSVHINLETKQIIVIFEGR